MVVDTSAIIAILEYEVEADQFAEAIQTDPVRFISAATLLECAIVIEARHGQAGGDKLDQMLHIANIQVEPVTAEQITAARLAFRTYGKGRHPAALNFGDCFSYALAKITDQPLLFKGNDFSQTDVRQV
ncbi:MAG: type II toxin-antitoxin system VapC family toxin [Anaerolineae bacterium]|nr:type II toxin-antitoxin system VapC family toxin [Anaerolineae bacterium]